MSNEREKEQHDRFVKAINEYLLFDSTKFKYLSERELERERRKPLNKFLKSLKAESPIRRTFNILTVDYSSKIDKISRDFNIERKKISETYEDEAIRDLAKVKKYSIPWIIKHTHIKRRESILLQIEKGTVQPKNMNQTEEGNNQWLFSKEEVEILEANIVPRKGNKDSSEKKNL